MEITGLKLRDAIKRWEIRRDSLKIQFENARYKFEDEAKDSPLDLSDKIVQAESNIVTLQCLQIRYNQQVKVRSDLLQKDISIAEGVKLSGAYDRVTKLWSAQTSSAKHHGVPTRNADYVVAKEMVPLNIQLQQVERYTKLASHIRTLVSHGNNITVLWDDKDLTSALFDA